MRFAILGSFQVGDDGQTLPVGRGTQRALLALLALHANEPLGADRIVADLWGDDSPASARDMVRLYVGRLRAIVGERLMTDAAGYLLRATEDEVDLLQFERFRRIGTEALAAGDTERAVSALGRAVKLWRGEPLVEFADLPFAREAIPQLDELRTAAAEDYHDARLALDGGSDLVPELERLVDEYPYRERLRAQLMLALYRAGRQTDALSRYREGRKLLVEEIGVEPGPRLRELERAILRQDPELAEASPVVKQPLPRPSRRGRPLLWIAIAAAIAAAGTATGLLTTHSGRAGLRSLPANSLGLVDSKSGRLFGAVRLPGVPVSVADAGGVVWVALGEPHELVEVDPQQRRVRRTIRLSSVPRRIAAGAGGVWVDQSYTGTIARVDAATGVVGQPLRLFAYSRIAFASARQVLWATSSPGSEAFKLDPRSGRVLTKISHLQDPIAASAGLGALWFAPSTRAEVQRATPSGVHSIPIGAPPIDITTGSGGVWAVTPSDAKLWRIDPRAADVTAIVALPPDPEFVVAGARSIWVATRQPGTLSRVDPATETIVSTLHLRHPVGALAVADGLICVAVA